MVFDNSNIAKRRKLTPMLLCVPVVALLIAATGPQAQAASLDEQISQLQRTNAQALDSKQQLANQALTLSETIVQLQAQISELDNLISRNIQRVDELNTTVAAAEKDLAGKRAELAASVRKMYIEQDTTTLEMLASSHSMSHFVDRQVYHADLQDKISATVGRIKKLEAQLTGEKKAVEDTLADQRAMQDHLDSQRAETRRLLSLNQQQQAEFDASVQANAERIARLQREQAAENGKGFVSRSAPSSVSAAPGSQYPWADAPFPNTLPDPWGMYQRQCVSYTAWKVASSGRHMPYWGGRGNANQWDDNARAAGIPVDTNPRVGDVAISNAGTYGHAMYVEAVNGDGTIYVSQYNADLRGNYSEGTRSTAGLVFIHFP